MQSKFPALNGMYNTLETPRFSGGVEVGYVRFIAKRWFLQAGINLVSRGYNTQLTDEYPGELQNDMTFVKAQAANELTQNLIQVQIPVVGNFIVKSADQWHAFFGVGFSCAKTIHYEAIWYDAETDALYPQFMINEGLKPGLRLQFGWLNNLENKNALLFLIKYDQELTPVSDTPIKRYLNAFTFTFSYMFSV